MASGGIRLTAIDEELPKGFGVIYAAGEPATDSNDGDTFFTYHPIFWQRLLGIDSFPGVRLCGQGEARVKNNKLMWQNVGLATSPKTIEGEQYVWHRRDC